MSWLLMNNLMRLQREIVLDTWQLWRWVTMEAMSRFLRWLGETLLKQDLLWIV